MTEISDFTVMRDMLKRVGIEYDEGCSRELGMDEIVVRDALGFVFKNDGSLITTRLPQKSDIHIVSRMLTLAKIPHTRYSNRIGLKSGAIFRFDHTGQLEGVS